MYFYTQVLVNLTMWSRDIFQICGKWRMNKAAASLTLWCLTACFKNKSIKNTLTCGGMYHTVVIAPRRQRLRIF